TAIANIVRDIVCLHSFSVPVTNKRGNPFVRSMNGCSAATDPAGACLGRPFAPMRRMQVDPFFAFSLDPSAQNALAWKGNRAHAHSVDNRELEIAIEWCGGYRVPHDFTSRLWCSDRVALCGGLDG